MDSPCKTTVLKTAAHATANLPCWRRSCCNACMNNNPTTQLLRLEHACAQILAFIRRSSTPQSVRAIQNELADAGLVLDDQRVRALLEILQDLGKVQSHAKTPSHGARWSAVAGAITTAVGTQALHAHLQRLLSAEGHAPLHIVSSVFELAQQVEPQARVAEG